MTDMRGKIVAPGEEHSVALALVNSRYNSRGGVVDQLGQPPDARTWLTEHGLLPDSAHLSDHDLHTLHELRAAVRAVMSARIGGLAPQPGAVATINVLSSAVPRTRSLAWEESAVPVAVEQPVGGDAVARALGAIALDAIDSVCSERASRLLQCAAPGCVRLLERDHVRRRWCSTACGDRVRAAHYYARRRVERPRAIDPGE